MNKTMQMTGSCLKTTPPMKSPLSGYHSNSVLFPAELSLTREVTNTQQDIAVSHTHRKREQDVLTPEATSLPV